MKYEKKKKEIHKVKAGLTCFGLHILENEIVAQLLAFSSEYTILQHLSLSLALFIAQGFQKGLV